MDRGPDLLMLAGVLLLEGLDRLGVLHDAFGDLLDVSPQVFRHHVEVAVPDRAAMGTLSFEVIETRVSADASMVTLAARWKLGYPGDGDREDASGLTLLVLQKGPDGWKIAQDASM